MSSWNFEEGWETCARLFWAAAKFAKHEKPNRDTTKALSECPSARHKDRRVSLRLKRGVSPSPSEGERCKHHPEESKRFPGQNPVEFYIVKFHRANAARPSGRCIKFIEFFRQKRISLRLKRTKKEHCKAETKGQPKVRINTFFIISCK